MMLRKFLLLLVALVFTACSTAPAEKSVPTIGMVLVGPINDGGWSQAHYDAMMRVEKDAGIKFVYVDKVNPADRPNVKVEQVIEELIGQGATMIITNSDDFKDGTRNAALSHPEVKFVHASGDDRITGKAPDNLGNMMGKMEYGKMIAGCTAALSTKTGKIGYVGPLINDETRRLINSAYLGANYCWTALRGETKPLEFNVVWVGFWFNIPGVTLDPVNIITDFVATGHDVIMGGIDTPDVAVQVAKHRADGKDVYSLPYDHPEACEKGPEACLGVPYFNWYPEYMKLAESHKSGTFKPDFVWFGPDWDNFGSMDTNGIGFVRGKAFTEDAALDQFIEVLAKGTSLWKGPLEYQDGSMFLEAGVVASTDQIWYQKKLLKGITGKSE
jgi:simple sugar transport system substrate-binding protein